MRIFKVLPSIETHVALSGLFSMGSRNHGFTPVATTCHPIRGSSEERMMKSYLKIGIVGNVKLSCSVAA